MRASDRAYATLLDEIQRGASPPAPCSARSSRPPASVSAAPRCAKRSAGSPPTGSSSSSRRASPSSPTSTRTTSASSSRCAARSKRPPPASPPSAAIPRLRRARRRVRAREILDGDSRADDYYALIARFDAALDAAVANDYLTSALRTVRTHLVRVRRLARDNPDRLAASVAEHRLIASAIAARDAELAAHATHVHLHNALTSILESVEGPRAAATGTTPGNRTRSSMTVTHHVRVHRSDENLAREDQLAWKIAEVAADPVEVEPEVVDMIINRVIDNAAVAAASLTRAPVSAARAAGARPRRVDRRRRRDRLRLRHRAAHQPGVGGVGERRRGARARLPRHLPRGRVLAPRRQHPADPRGRPARRRRRRRARPRHRHRLRDPDRPGAARSACTSTRSTTSPTSARRPPPASARCSASTSRRSTRPSARRCTPRPRPGSRARARSRRWKAHAPAFAGKMAVEAVDRAMRGETSPSPDLRGRGRRHRLAARRTRMPRTRCRCPSRARPSARILDTYTKEHSAEYQAQAWIDLARKLARRAPRARATRRTSSRSCCTPATTPTT